MLGLPPFISSGYLGSIVCIYSHALCCCDVALLLCVVDVFFLSHCCKIHCFSRVLRGEHCLGSLNLLDGAGLASL